MGVLDKLVGGAAAAPITAIGNIVTGIFGDKGEKLTHDEVMARIALQPTMVQSEINKVEAAHRSVFVAGWRPFIGWCCGAGILNLVLINPWIQWITDNPGPELPSDVIMQLTLGILGLLGTMRTVEKVKGRSK